MTPEEIVRSLRACGGHTNCAGCYVDPSTGCFDRLTLAAADLIEQQDARIAGLEAKVPRWIPVTERLPQKGDDGLQDCDWVRCIVSVIWTYSGAGTHMFPAPALFDADQKIWHVGQKDEPGFSVNALIPLEDSDGGYFVAHWMPYPKPAQEGNK